MIEGSRFVFNNYIQINNVPIYSRIYLYNINILEANV